jgi:diguanylate cyclase (GGDEF)-like protein
MPSGLSPSSVSSIQGKIIVLAVAAISITAVCSAMFIVQTRANIQAQVFQDQAGLGQTYARVVQEYLNGSRSVIEGLAQVPAVRAPLDTAAIQPELKGIPQTTDPERRAAIAGTIAGSGRMLSMVMVATNGDLYLIEPYALQTGFALPNLLARPHIARALNTGLTSWSDVIVDLATNQPAVVVEVPIKDASGTIQSILGSSLDLQGLAVAAHAIQPGQTGSVMLFDSHGIPIIYPDATRIASRQPLNELPLIRDALAGHPGSYAYDNPLTGQAELGTIVPLPDNGWYAVVSQTQAEAFAGLNRIISILAAVLAASVLLLLVGSLLLARGIARSLGKVERAATGLAAGDLDQEVNVWSNDELGRMAGAFRRMIGYHQHMAAIADAVAGGDLNADVQPQSPRDRLGIALQGMVGNLRRLVARLEQRTAEAERLVSEMQVQIAERKRAEEALEHQAFHDALTGLPNRALFADRLEHALARADRQGKAVAVLFLDLDNFKVVNDSLGHAQGDALLVAVAERLRACLRIEDTGARLGGDEFTVLLEDVAGEAEAIAVAERIASALCVPVTLQGREVVVSASIGVALGHAHGGNKDLLREADLAMYRAKTSGKARCALFNPDLETRAVERLEMETDLRRALANDEFRVHYQPIVSVVDEGIVGVEALVRWEHPSRGLVQPLAFIPVAEETGLIIPIGRWVLEQACQQAHLWQQQHPRANPLTVSVNLSARQLQAPNLIADVARALQLSGLAPEALELEITESVIMQDAEATDATLHALKAIGVRLAIDDFGTGYSSLSYLKRFPVDTLKIDRSFVDGLGHDSQDTAVVHSVAALARALDLSVTGEGVETRAQHTLLKQIGCERSQGFLYAKPAAAAEISVILALGTHGSHEPLAA